MVEDVDSEEGFVASIERRYQREVVRVAVLRNAGLIHKPASLPWLNQIQEFQELLNRPCAKGEGGRGGGVGSGADDEGAQLAPGSLAFDFLMRYYGGPMDDLIIVQKARIRQYVPSPTK